ncbi:hypothetical protein Y032_0062g3320 [Ancylostoma ceylanicum]|uniref:Uncharacterized protein n=1 Tax=Ancylostoma ceylanicum TaxID=53326 RepID=A0A016U1A5_9BILA|nr:hypothetical protein Y032_0062g3320 [Ancylostoma ceylanicum]
MCQGHGYNWYRVDYSTEIRERSLKCRMFEQTDDRVVQLMYRVVQKYGDTPSDSYLTLGSKLAAQFPMQYFSLTIE